ncbi:unnamed protein product [Mytilus coruscus]|uniref:Uncharacterized protein n=1 Tax=Mytilus coruscus TaxID=42192 RepID=A0A6J8F1I6_MYTCO|nr:unnamed protein product [Mytilus coruscus]
MKAIKLIHLPLLVTFIPIKGTAVKPCSTATHLPVVDICADETKSQDATNSVLIKADKKQNCKCELHVENQDQDVQVSIKKYALESSSSPSELGCGLVMKFKIKDRNWEAQCKVDNNNISMIITMSHVMTIRSLTVNGTLNPNEGYCIEIRKATYDTTKNQLKLTCGIGSITTTETTQSSEKTTKMTRTTNATTTTTTPKTTMRKSTTVTTVPLTTEPVTTTTTLPTTNIITTTTISTKSTDTNEHAITNFISTDSSVTTNKANQLKNEDNDDITVLAACASVGGFVIIIGVIVVVCIYRRNHKKSTSKPGPAVNTDNDDYGLRDNVLYVSSQPSETTQTPNNADSPTTNMISIDIDSNYSTVDLDEIPSVEESTGDNCSIDLEKPTPTASNMNGSSNKKPIIAPKPKQKMTIQDDVYSVPDKKRVKHVTAPGENECEYAVVSKPNKSNIDKSEDQHSTSNVYAVVEKKKRMSDGKGTNQKRDSLKAENDGETGQS